MLALLKIGKSDDNNETNDDINDKIAELKDEIENIKQKIIDIKKSKSNKILKEMYLSNQNTEIKEKIPQLRLTNQLKGHYGKIYTIAWANDSKHIVSGSKDGKLLLWNVVSGNKIHVVWLSSSYVMTCGISPEMNINDVRFVGSGGLDNMVSLYNIKKDSIKSEAMDSTKLFQGHQGYVSTFKFIDSDRIISGSGDSKCMEWDVDQGIVIIYSKIETI